MSRPLIFGFLLSAFAILAITASPRIASPARAQSSGCALTPVDQTQLSIGIGDETVVGLESNQTTGYSWQLAQSPDPTIAIAAGSQYFPSGSGLIGAGGMECWTFQGVGAGTTSIQLNYARPFEPGQPAARIRQFTITVGPAPSDWTEIGSQSVTGSSWNYDGQDFLDPSATFLRVRAGGCEGDPGAFAMEANLQRQDTGAGLDVWEGTLHLVGTAAGVNSVVGHARLSRPVTLNPITQVDVTLFNLTGVLRGAELFVCVRTA
jgi:predicted secreted protein